MSFPKLNLSRVPSTCSMYSDSPRSMYNACVGQLNKRNQGDSPLRPPSRDQIELDSLKKQFEKHTSLLKIITSISHPDLSDEYLGELLHREVIILKSIQNQISFIENIMKS